MTRSISSQTIAVGDELPGFDLPVTSTVIVAGAIASRDFMPAHHDPVFARAQGAPDMFHRALGAEDVEVGGEVGCIGVGRVRRTSPIEPFEWRGGYGAPEEGGERTSICSAKSPVPLSPSTKTIVSGGTAASSRASSASSASTMAR